MASSTPSARDDDNGARLAPPTTDPQMTMPAGGIPTSPSTSFQTARASPPPTISRLRPLMQATDNGIASSPSSPNGHIHGGFHSPWPALDERREPLPLTDTQDGVGLHGKQDSSFQPVPSISGRPFLPSVVAPISGPWSGTTPRPLGPRFTCTTEVAAGPSSFLGAGSQHDYNPNRSITCQPELQYNPLETDVATELSRLTMHGNGTLEPASTGYPSNTQRPPGSALVTFEPMDNISIRPPNQPPRAPSFIEHISLGFSPYYQGNIHLSRNRSADIPADQNCSLFLTNLPAQVTVHELLAQIRTMGRIYATHVNPPEPLKGHHSAAAKLVFFDLAAAHKFYNHCHLHSFSVNGQVARVVYNRIKTAQSTEPVHVSRVLIIAGPSTIVNERDLTQFFRSKIEFQVDEIILKEFNVRQNRSIVEYRFGSYRCQAQAAKMALTRELGRYVQVYYGPDPCA